MKNRLKWGLLSLIVILLIWQSTRLMVRPIHGDEAEHAHAAYRVFRGDRPFDDFFEHHCPGLWYLLFPYYFLGGYGAGVLFWGRTLCIISLLLITGLSGAIGRRFGLPLAGELAALIVLPFAIANKYIQVRPECVMLPLVLGGVYATIRFLQQKKCGEWLIVAFALVSLSIFFSPRAVIVWLWLGLIYTLNFRRFSLVRHLVLIIAAVVGPVLLIGISGAGNCYRWIYQFSLALYPPFSLRHVWIELLTDQYVLIIGLVGGGLALFRTREPARYLGGLTIATILFLISHTIKGVRTPDYAWAIASVLSSVMFAYWCGYLISRNKAGARYIVLILLLPWLIFSARALARPALMLTLDGKKVISNPATLAEEVAEMDDFSRRYKNQGPAWVVWDFDVHLIPVEDISYFWFVPCNVPKTLRRAGLDSRPLRWAADIRLRRPFAVSKTLVDELIPGAEIAPGWWNWFQANYRAIKRPRGDYLYWRRDVTVSPKDIAQ